MSHERVILPCITSSNGLDHQPVDWMAKVREADALGIKELGLFVTTMKAEDRRSCFRTLSYLGIGVRFLHACAAMTPDEYDYVEETFAPQVYNLHTTREFPIARLPSKKIRQKTFIENSGLDLIQDDLTGWGGILIDTAHAWDLRLSGGSQGFAALHRLVRDNKVGGNHLSPIAPEPYLNGTRMAYDTHTLTHLSQYDYLLELPFEFYGPVKTLEVTNSLSDQLQIIKYLRCLLD
jgi:hypothetical protein